MNQRSFWTKASRGPQVFPRPAYDVLVLTVPTGTVLLTITARSGGSDTSGYVTKVSLNAGTTVKIAADQLTVITGPTYRSSYSCSNRSA